MIKVGDTVTWESQAGGNWGAQDRRSDCGCASGRKCSELGAGGS